MRPDTAAKASARGSSRPVMVPADTVGPREAKRGRPRIGEPHEPHRPWVAAGMSERTWYRRKAQAKAGK